MPLLGLVVLRHLLGETDEFDSDPCEDAIAAGAFWRY